MRRVVNQNIQKRKLTFSVVLFLESKFDVGMLRVDEFKERNGIPLIFKNAKIVKLAKIGAKGEPIATPSTRS